MPKTYVPRFDITSRFSSLEKKTTVILHPRCAEVPDVRVSKMGGRIAWPLNEPWPRCPVDDGPMVAVLQIRREDIPELGFPEGKDLFQMLWCPTQDHEESQFAPLARCFWRDSGTLGSILEVVPELVEADSDCLPKECCLHPERVEELPSAFELDSETLEALNAWIKEHGREEMEELQLDFDGSSYQYNWSVSPSSKVGGHVDWVQDPWVPTCECGNAMEHLLSLASFEYGGGTSQRWYPMDGSWEEKRVSFFCFGDAGNYYVFVCRKCVDMPVITDMQCS